MKKVLFLVIIILVIRNLNAGNIEDAVALYNDKKYEDASTIFLSILDEETSTSDSRSLSFFYLGKIMLDMENPNKNMALYYFENAFEYAQSELSGDVACELAILYGETTETLKARNIFDQLYKGQIATSNETFGKSAYSYALFSVRNLKDKNLAKDILYNLDSGDTSATLNYVHRGRYTLGHILAKEEDFKEANRIFIKVDFSDQEINWKADISLQQAWSYMEYCRKLFYAETSDSEYTFSKARELCQKVTLNYDNLISSGISEKIKNYFSAVADLMYLETYWYEKNYEVVPGLVEQFFEKYESDPYRKRELAMARFWSAASYHKIGNYSMAFQQFDLLQQYQEAEQKGFINIPAYVTLIKADCYYRMEDNDNALLYLGECLEKYPEFTRRRLTMKESFPVYNIFDQLEN